VARPLSCSSVSSWGSESQRNNPNASIIRSIGVSFPPARAATPAPIRPAARCGPIRRSACPAMTALPSGVWNGCTRSRCGPISPSITRRIEPPSRDGRRLRERRPPGAWIAMARSARPGWRSSHPWCHGVSPVTDCRRRTSRRPIPRAPRVTFRSLVRRVCSSPTCRASRRRHRTGKRGSPARQGMGGRPQLRGVAWRRAARPVTRGSSVSPVTWTGPSSPSFRRWRRIPAGRRSRPGSPRRRLMRKAGSSNVTGVMRGQICAAAPPATRARAA
jgi:hypothetical protein